MAQAKKIERCKYAFLHIKGDYHCVQAGWEDDKVAPTDEEKCENCSNFKSRYLEFPVTVNNIEHEKLKYNEDTWHCIGKSKALWRGIRKEDVPRLLPWGSSVVHHWQL